LAFCAAPLMRFVAPSALSNRLSPLIAGLPGPLRSVPRVSHPLDGLLLGRSTRPCFMPERSWSSNTLQSFFLVRSRNASRRPHALLPFTSTTHDRHGDPLVAAQPRKVAPAWGLVVWLQGLAPRNELVAIAVGFLGRLRARCSPGFHSPSGFALCDSAPWCFHPGSSHELLVVRSPTRYGRSHRTLSDRPGSPEYSRDRE